MLLAPEGVLCCTNLKDSTEPVLAYLAQGEHSCQAYNQRQVLGAAFGSSGPLVLQFFAQEKALEISLHWLRVKRALPTSLFLPVEKLELCLLESLKMQRRWFIAQRGENDTERADCHELGAIVGAC